MQDILKYIGPQITDIRKLYTVGPSSRVRLCLVPVAQTGGFPARRYQTAARQCLSSGNVIGLTHVGSIFGVVAKKRRIL